MKAAPLLDALRGVRPVASAEIADVERALEMLVSAAREGRPELATDDAAFVRFVAERLPRGGTLAAAVHAVAAADLLLAWACLEGVPAALASFDSSLRQVVAGICRSRTFHGLSDELEQTLRHKLLAEPPPKLAQYSGRGALEMWLRAVATRSAISLTRGSGKERPEEERDELALASPDPELQLIQEQYRQPFRLAFRAALAAMTGDQRTLLRLHFIDGLSHEQIAKLERVHQSTVTRRLTAARTELMKTIREELTQRLRIKPQELDSLVRGARSQLDVSLSALQSADLK